MSRALFTRGLLVLCTLALTAVYPVTATTPSVMTYQGRLTNTLGTPVSDATYSVRFRIYDDSLAGSSFWEETKNVTTKGGLFTVRLGEIDPLGQNVFTISPDLFLGIKVGTNAEMTPRTRLSLVPYATTVGTIDGANGGLILGDISVTGTVFGTPLTGAQGGHFSTTGGNSALQGRYMGPGNVNGVGLWGQALQSEHLGYGGYFEGGFAGAFGYNTADTVGGGTYKGIYGLARSEFPGAKTLIGVHGSVEGMWDNIGILGESISSLSDQSINIGVKAIGGGTPSSLNFGLYAQSSGAADNYGVYSEIFGSGYAGYFQGETRVSGNLSKTTGTFQIDHPLDPENKYLQHSFVESPDMMNIYNGIVTLDANGTATITMPEWFGALNRDFRYQLTAVGGPGPNLYVSAEITNNQFSIAGGSAGLKVSWQVTGVRQDPYAEAHRIQVEVDKRREDRGTYLHPEVYGKSEERRQGYAVTKRMADAAAERRERDRQAREEREQLRVGQ